jgi:gluconokinase
VNRADPPFGIEKTVVVVMGVAGSGKTTIGQILAERLHWPFADADDFHPAANVAKMASGTPLTDQDRWPWLQAIRAWIDANPGDAVVTCSALRRRYRDVLRGEQGHIRFLHLDGTIPQLESRLSARTNHFMLATMLASQLRTLEPLEDDEDGVVISIMQTPQQIVDQAINALRLRGTPADA